MVPRRDSDSMKPFFSITRWEGEFVEASGAGLDPVQAYASERPPAKRKSEPRRWRRPPPFVKRLRHQ